MVQRALREEKLVVYGESEGSSGGLSSECRGWEIRDQEDEKIGKVEEVFVDGNDRPEYLGVKAGLLGGKLTLIPVDIARATDEKKVIEVSESRDRIKEAPSLGSNEEITARRERGIRDHFGLDSYSSTDNDLSKEGDTSEISLVYRQDPEDQETQASDASDQPPDESGEDEGRTSGSGSDAPSERSPTESFEAAGAVDPVRQDRSGDPSGGRETMRVNVWREKAWAALVLGDDGSEEVRIRREWVEEEEIVEVEDRR